MSHVKHQVFLNKFMTFNNGELQATEDVVIDCHFNGTRIDAGNNSVIVGLPCTVNADIYAGTVQVIGTLNGNVTASEGIYLADTAVVRGDLSAPRVQIEKNTRYQGRITYT